MGARAIYLKSVEGMKSESTDRTILKIRKMQDIGRKLHGSQHIDQGDELFWDAVKLIEELREKGHTMREDMNNLGHCLQHGNGVTKDPVKAVEWYTKAADAGDTS